MCKLCIKLFIERLNFNMAQQWIFVPFHPLRNAYSQITENQPTSNRLYLSGDWKAGVTSSYYWWSAKRQWGTKPESKRVRHTWGYSWHSILLFLFKPGNFSPALQTAGKAEWGAGFPGNWMWGTYNASALAPSLLSTDTVPILCPRLKKWPFSRGRGREGLEAHSHQWARESHTQ